MAARCRIPFLVFEATGACGLRCRYCYNPWRSPGAVAAAAAGGGATDPGPGSYGRSRRTLKAAFAQADIGRVTFSGGEPLLAERVLELVLFCRRRGARVGVITSGSAGGERELRDLLRLGVDVFELPLHAPEAGPHDDLTGVAGSWERARRGLRRLVELGAEPVAVIVLTRLNADLAADTIRLAERLGVRRVMLARFNPGGRGLREWRQLLPERAQLRRAFAAAERLARERRLAISANVCLPACVLDPRDHPHVPISRCSPDPLRRAPTLTATGDLRACNHSPVVAGNLHERPLAEILAGPYLRGWGRAVPSFCRGCRDWGRCHGGCRAAAEQLGGGLEDVDPIVPILGSPPGRGASAVVPGPAAS